MIAILLEDMHFEQDIRELFMAFYPGEQYTHDPGEKAMIVFEGRNRGERYEAGLRIEEGAAVRESGFSCKNHSDRLRTKNEIKRSLYDLLSSLNKRELPWGTLTGIRPTKIIMEKLEKGKERGEMEEELRRLYRISDKKLKLALDTALREKKILEGLDYEKGWSLYIGIPFCPTTCLYCSFTSYPIERWKERKKEYIRALSGEIRAMAGLMRGRRLQSVYMGGGTPTSLEAEDLKEILATLRDCLDLSGISEFCVEAGRPDSISREKLEVLRAFGVNRISINPQSMNQKTLDLIGRKHSVEEVEEVYRMAEALGFDHINMDLILGLPGEKAQDVEHSFQRISALAPKSLTVHSLAIKRASRLNTNEEKIRYMKESEKEMDRMVEIAEAACRRMGLSPYYLYRQKNMAGNHENVGYCLPGYECIYNILIMEEKQSIIACGAGASSKLVWREENRVERVENVKDPDLYIRRLDEMIDRKITLAKSALNL
ncbi:MAG: coproporphyrinogen dehydrogenase HemZ [Johnsonella sp.]|nr:coproporphyrinogen dehydrogenase HemZ [Johnsonella sp.]